MKQRAIAALLAAGFAAAAGAQTAPSARELASLSLEELANIEVTSVSRRPEALSSAAASIFVITAEDIRRSGARRLPDALRLAPNLQVARTAASTYAISARGFNNAVGNKLLVLVDGRTIYTPLFSGVFWEHQDVPLADVERIEVITGPGGSLWGLNAVNGVINVITRSAAETHGTFVSAEGGGEGDYSAMLRHGAAVAGGHVRVYAMAHRLENSESGTGTPIADGWKQAQVGFRADWALAKGHFTLQGDAYQGKSDHRGFAAGLELTPVEGTGGNLLARWSRELGTNTGMTVQAYVDHSDRDEMFLFSPEQTLYDVEAQVSHRMGAHQIVAGGGHRIGKDTVEPGVFTAILPPSRRMKWTNLFIQDEYAVTERVALTAGLKLERNDYTGWEHLPTLRLAWKPDEARLLWAAASRAVRAPARFDRDVFLPTVPPFLIAGGEDFRSEIAEVYELGYRAHPTPKVQYSVTAFLHRWDHLRSGEAPPGMLVNQMEGTSSGVEAWAAWQPMRGWRLYAGGMWLNMKLRLEPGSTDPVGVGNDTLANDPQWQWSLRSSHDLPGNLELDIYYRSVARLRNTPTPAYQALDVRLGWRVSPRLDVSILGRNLTDASHIEFNAPANAAAFERGVFARVDYRF